MSTSRETVFCEYPEDLADAAAAMINEAQNSAIRERGVFRIAFSSSDTARLLIETLLRDWSDDMQWERWEVFWADECAVPPDSEHSNYNLAKSLLLSNVPVGAVYRMGGEVSDLSHAAREYELTLTSKLDDLTFDLVLLGMGEDGHTASLYPGSPALTSAKLVEAVNADEAVSKRLTLTPKLLNHARLVLFLITGDAKAAAVKAILADDNDSLPAARILPAAGRVLFLLDDAAASHLA